MNNLLIALLLILVALAIVACQPETARPEGRIERRGGGWIKLDNGSKATFGFTMVCDPETGASGQLQYVDYESGVKFHGEMDLLPSIVVCTTGIPPGAFAGTYRPQPKGASGSFLFAAQDYGEPGASAEDLIYVELVDGEYGGYSAMGTLGGGNIQGFK
jgi:hypothetical protein